MAVLRAAQDSINTLIQMLLQQEFTSQNQAAEDERLRLRQIDADERAFSENALARNTQIASQDPHAARRMGPGFEQFVPTPDELVATGIEDARGSSLGDNANAFLDSFRANLESLQPELGLEEGQMGPPESLRNEITGRVSDAFNAQQESLLAEDRATNRTKVDSVGPTGDGRGMAQSEWHPTRDLGNIGYVRTEPTGEEQVQRDLGALDPRIRSAETRMAGQVAGGVRREQNLADISPDIIAGRAAQAGATTTATKTAEHNFVLANFEKMLDMDMRKNSALLESTEVATDIIEARTAAAKDLPQIMELADLWNDAAPAIRAWVNRFPGGEAKDILQAASLNQMTNVMIAQIDDQTVRQYLELRDAFKPSLARFMGQRGNLTEIEQERGGMLVPHGIDALDPEFSGSEKFERVIGFSLAGPSMISLIHQGLAGPELIDAMRNLADLKKAEVSSRFGLGRVGGPVPLPEVTRSLEDLRSEVGR